MEFQPNLFGDDDRAYARNTDPETSWEAAESVDVGRLEGMVLSVLRQYPDGLTGKQVAHILNMQTDTIRPRFRPLANKGLIYDCGERRIYCSKTSQIVWKATTKGERHG